MDEMIDESQLKKNAKLFIKLGTPKPMMVVLIAVLVSGLVAVLQILVRYGGVSGLGMLLSYRINGTISNAEMMYLLSAMSRPGGTLIGWLLSIVSYMVSAGLIMYYMQQVRGRNGTFGSLLDAFPQVFRIIGYEIITGIFVFLWSLLFIIPGIIAVYRYSQGLYILLDHPEYGIMDCISESKRMMNGRKMDYFVLQLSFIGWFLLEVAVQLLLTVVFAFVFSPIVYESVEVFAVLSYALPALCVLPLSIYITAYQGFTFFQYYDALQGRFYDPTQPPAPETREPEQPTD